MSRFIILLYGFHQQLGQFKLKSWLISLLYILFLLAHQQLLKLFMSSYPDLYQKTNHSPNTYLEQESSVTRIDIKNDLIYAAFRVTAGAR